MNNFEMFDESNDVCSILLSGRNDKRDVFMRHENCNHVE